MTEQKEKRILLICTAGITSGLLVKNIQTAADEQNIPIRVYSAPAIIAEQAIQNQQIDGLMIGPQSEYEVNRELQSGELQDDQEGRLRNVRWRGCA